MTNLSKRRCLLATAVFFLLILVAAFIVQSKILRIRGEEVTLISGDASLAATLALPRWGEGPFPAIVVVHGSGRVTRADLRSYGGQFVPLGMAVLFYDKRGVGESGGRYRPYRVSDCEDTFRELASDAAAAVRYLKGRSDIDPDRIGLLGGSQAGWVMPLAARLAPDVSFIVSLAGPAVTCGQLDFYQSMTGIGRGRGVPVPDADVIERVGAFTGPHGFDPVPTLRSLRIPTLWLSGKADLHVPSALTASLVRDLIRKGRTNHTIIVVPNADHDFHHASSGELIDPLPEVREWLESIRVLSP